MSILEEENASETGQSCIYVAKIEQALRHRISVLQMNSHCVANVFMYIRQGQEGATRCISRCWSGVHGEPWWTVVIPTPLHHRAQARVQKCYLASFQLYLFNHIVPSVQAPVLSSLWPQYFFLFYDRQKEILPSPLHLGEFWRGDIPFSAVILFGPHLENNK